MNNKSRHMVILDIPYEDIELIAKRCELQVIISGNKNHSSCDQFAYFNMMTGRVVHTRNSMIRKNLKSITSYDDAMRELMKYRFDIKKETE